MRRANREAACNSAFEDAAEERHTPSTTVSEHLITAHRLAAIGRIAHGIAHEINSPAQYISDGACFVESAFHDLHMLLETYRAAVAQLPPSGAGSTPRVVADIRNAEATANALFLEREVPRALSRVLEGVRHMTFLITALKDFVQSGSAEPRAASINHAIEVALATAHSHYKYIATAETHFAVLPDVVCRVGELTQAFFILIISAAGAIARAAVADQSNRIRISTALARDTVEVRFDIIGCGDAPNDFEQLIGASYAETGENDHSARDLAVARCIVVERHCGRITVERLSAAGVSILVSLPLATSGTGVSS